MCHIRTPVAQGSKVDCVLQIPSVRHASLGVGVRTPGTSFVRDLPCHECRKWSLPQVFWPKQRDVIANESLRAVLLRISLRARQNRNNRIHQVLLSATGSASISTAYHVDLKVRKMPAGAHMNAGIHPSIAVMPKPCPSPSSTLQEVKRCHESGRRRDSPAKLRQEPVVLRVMSCHLCTKRVHNRPTFSPWKQTYRKDAPSCRFAIIHGYESNWGRAFYRAWCTS